MSVCAGFCEWRAIAQQRHAVRSRLDAHLAARETVLLRAGMAHWRWLHANGRRAAAAAPIATRFLAAVLAARALCAWRQVRGSAAAARWRSAELCTVLLEAAERVSSGSHTSAAAPRAHQPHGAVLPPRAQLALCLHRACSAPASRSLLDLLQRARAAAHSAAQHPHLRFVAPPGPDQQRAARQCEPGLRTVVCASAQHESPPGGHAVQPHACPEGTVAGGTFSNARYARSSSSNSNGASDSYVAVVATGECWARTCSAESPVTLHPQPAGTQRTGDAPSYRRNTAYSAARQRRQPQHGSVSVSAPDQPSPGPLASMPGCSVRDPLVAPRAAAGGLHAVQPSAMAAAAACSDAREVRAASTLDDSPGALRFF